MSPSVLADCWGPSLSAECRAPGSVPTALQSVAAETRPIIQTADQAHRQQKLLQGLKWAAISSRVQTTMCISFLATIQCVSQQAVCTEQSQSDKDAALQQATHSTVTPHVQHTCPWAPHNYCRQQATSLGPCLQHWRNPTEGICY